MTGTTFTIDINCDSCNCYVRVVRLDLTKLTEDQVGKAIVMAVQSHRAEIHSANGGSCQKENQFDCFSGTNCGNDNCVAHGGHGADS